MIPCIEQPTKNDIEHNFTVRYLIKNRVDCLGGDSIWLLGTGVSNPINLTDDMGMG